jgi:hypothetical protein
MFNPAHGSRSRVPMALWDRSRGWQAGDVLPCGPNRIVGSVDVKVGTTEAQCGRTRTRDGTRLDVAVLLSMGIVLHIFYLERRDELEGEEGHRGDGDSNIVASERDGSTNCARRPEVRGCRRATNNCRTLGADAFKKSTIRSAMLLAISDGGGRRHRRRTRTHRRPSFRVRRRWICTGP